MNLILHQAMKDLRAQRWLVAAWAAVLGCLCAIEALKLDVRLASSGLWVDAGWVRLAGSQPSPINPGLTRLLFALTLARVLLAWAIVIRTVHTDPVDGDTEAFWLTRPLSPAMLLASKASVIVGLLLAVPAAAAAFVFISNGVPWAIIPLAVLRWALFEALFIVPVALFAAMTRDLARMVLGVIAAALARLAVQAFGSGWHGGGNVMPFHDPLPWVVLALAVVVGSAALIALQYETRRTPRTVVGFGAVMLAVVAGAWAWPVKTAIDRAARPFEWEANSQVTLSLPADSVHLATAPYRRNGVEEQAVHLVGKLSVGGLPPDVVVRISRATATLRFSGQDAEPVADVRGSGLSFFAVDPLEPASRANFERVLGARLVAVPGSTAPSPGLQMWTPPPGRQYREYEGRRAAYEARLKVLALRVGSPATMPLQPGASATTDGVETTVLGIGRDRTSGVITFRRASPAAWFARSGDRVEFVLRNRRRGEAIVIWNDANERPSLRVTHTFVVTTDGMARFETPATGVDGQTWLADAELVIVPLQTLGFFERTVGIADLVLPPLASAEPAASGR